MPSCLEWIGVDPSLHSHCLAARAQLAMDVATVMRDGKIEAPDRIVPNGDGGLVFRWHSGEFTWSLELDVDGSMETTLMEEHTLVCRHSLHVPASR